MTEQTPPVLRESATFDRLTIQEIQRAAETGIYDIRGGGTKRKLPHFDDLLLLGASVSRYPLEGYREKCGTDVILGNRFAKKPIHLKIPVTIAGMSFGALSANAKEALGRGATIAGTSTTTGDGGMTPEERGQSQHLVYQYLPSRYGMNPDDLRKADAIEIVLGQGAKPGGGGMLLGMKVTERVAGMRTLPIGVDQRSACRHRTGPAPMTWRSRLPSCVKSPIGKTDLRENRREPAVLRREAGGQGRRRCDRARRHARRHRRDPGSVYRACGHSDFVGHPASGTGFARDGHAPQGPVDRVGRDS